MENSMNKKNFSIKIFIGITCISLAVGLFVFGILRIYTPRIYANELEKRLEINTADLKNQLETSEKIVWKSRLEYFCYSNNLNATVYDGKGLVEATYGLQLDALLEYGGTHRNFDFPAALKFLYIMRDDTSYTIVFYADPQEIDQVISTFEIVFPILFTILLIISLFIAFLCTRFIVNNRNLQIAIEDERRRRNFFSAISHELKTPVTILKGELDGMILNVGKFKDRDKYLQEAYETTESIEKLVREIMTAAKLDILKPMPEEINLSEITNECLQKIDELIDKKNIYIKQDFSDIPIVADKKLIGIVISNVIGNAVKHSPQGSGQAAEINICFDETLRFSVLNHGTHIGETSSDSDLSSGLGLYIVKTILDMHEFKYSFENFGDGTKFTIIFTKM
jgi:two-component system sensor histidine kinase VanS